VILPPKHIEQVGWEEGIELEAIVENGEIVLRPKE
jgi:antitoxin component of MazEF toxin-antitoxin module